MTTDEIRAFSMVIAILGALKVIGAGPDDEAVLECAVLGQARYLVSGDRHLLDVGNYQVVRIMKASEFLTVIQSASKV